MNDLADDLRQEIERSGLSRFELAKRAGLPYSVVHHFVGGQRSLTIESAGKLCKALGLRLVRRRKGR